MTQKVSVTNIGASKDVSLPFVNDTKRTLIVFSGSNAGNATVTAKLTGGDKFETVTDGTISLATRKYMMIPDAPLSELRITYDGVAQLDATVYVLS